MPSGSGRRGSVRQADNGSWYFVVDTSAPGGPRQQLRRRGFPTRRAAQAVLTETLTNLAEQTYVAPSRLNFGEYVTSRWLPAIEGELRPSTFASYSRNLRLHVLPEVGRVSLQSLDAGTLTALYQRLARDGRKDHVHGTGLSATTVRYIHTIVRSALQTAVEWDLLIRNPADRTKPPRPRAQADRHKKINTWPREVLAAFLTATTGTRLHPLWLLLATTGLRRGEALGLTWRAVDLSAGRLSVIRSLVDVEYGRPVWSDPKTSRGRRSVALDPATLAALKTLRAEQLQERLLVGADYAEHDLVFARAEGGPRHPDRTAAAFRETVARLGLPAIRLHDLRHTWATLALEAGVHPKVVQERLGHANVSITLDLYSHVAPAMATDAASKVAALILGT
jgi:integrase